MATKKKRDFQRIPLYMQPEKVLDELFNDDDSLNDIKDQIQNLSPVAISGSYKDLKDVPTNVDGSYNDQPILDRLDKLEKAESEHITADQIATSDEVLAMYK